jgi:hypothetical protein
MFLAAVTYIDRHQNLLHHKNVKIKLLILLSVLGIFGYFTYKFILTNKSKSLPVKPAVVETISRQNPFGALAESENFNKTPPTIEPAPEEKETPKVEEKPTEPTPEIKELPSAEFSTKIEIRGDKNCKENTLSALKLLFNKAHQFFEHAEKYIGIIECVDKGSGIYVYEDPPRYLVGSSTLNSGDIWYAGTIVHDAQHSRLYREYGKTPVPSEVYSGDKAEASCIQVQYEAISALGADQATLDFLKSVHDTKYWEIDYEDRWW